MASIYPRKGRLWARLKGLKAPGKWGCKRTPFTVGQETQAQRYADEAQDRLDARNAAGVTGPLTVRAYVARWLEERRKLDQDWRNDRGRLEHHVLPVIGNMPLAEVRARHLVQLFHRIRTTPRKGATEPVAPRTVYNIYAVVSALFRDAELAGLIDKTPCRLDERQLGPLVDRDPEWRAQSVFSRDEATTIISTPVIPPDRQMVYALELLAGIRTGETAALRWRHYDPAVKPLGKLLVASSYNTRKNRTKGTKTEAVKHIPVHPTLAAMLAEWKLSGWAAMMGRSPGPDDLIVPLPPDHAARRRTRDGEPFRGHDYSGKRWREEDLPALGWRHRQHYDMRATFITLALDDGADPRVLEARVTHTKRSRSAFDGYNRGQQWEIACAEVAKLRLARAPRDVPGREVAVGDVPSASSETVLHGVLHEPDLRREKQWRRRESNPTECTPESVRGESLRVVAGDEAATDDHERSSRVASLLLEELAERVLSGERLAARRIAERVRGKRNRAVRP